MTKSTKVAAVNTSATRDHAALAGELSQLALQAGYLNQRSASLPNVMGLPDGCTAPLQDIILRAQSTAEAVDANQAVQDAFTAYLAAPSPRFPHACKIQGHDSSAADMASIRHISCKMHNTIQI